MITSVVAGLHSSAVKLTMIRRRSRALTHRTFPILFSVLLLSNFQFLLFRPTSLSLSLSLSFYLRFSSFFSSPLVPRLLTGANPFPSRMVLCPFLSSSSSTNRPEIVVAFPSARLSTPLRAPRVPGRSRSCAFALGER